MPTGPMTAMGDRSGGSPQPGNAGGRHDSPENPVLLVGDSERLVPQPTSVRMTASDLSASAPRTGFASASMRRKASIVADIHEPDAIRAIDIAVAIEQTYWSIGVTLMSAESTSQSTASSVRSEPDSPRPPHPFLRVRQHP